MSEPHLELHLEPRLELNLELLLGKKVRDPDGKVIGRIEEFVVEEGPAGAHLVEMHLGSAAFFERLGGAMLTLPFLSKLQKGREPHRVRWEEIDVSDPNRPRLRGVTLTGEAAPPIL